MERIIMKAKFETCNVATIVVAFMAVLSSSLVNAESWNYGDLTNELQVAASETYTLTADDAATLGSKCLHLTGEGTVIGNGAFTNFTGNVRISNGIFRYDTHGGLGIEDSTQRELKIDGNGTLHNKTISTHAWSRAGGYPSVPLNMRLYLEGDGYQGMGAVYNDVSCENLAHNVELTGDTTLACSNWENLQFRYANVNMNKHSIKCLPKTNFGMVALWLVTEPSGDFQFGKDGDGARFYLSDSIFPMLSSTWYLRGTVLYCDRVGGDSEKKENCSTIEFSEGSILETQRGMPLLDKYMTNDKTNFNRFQGKVILKDDVKLRIKDDTGVAFDGEVSGDKGFVYESGSGYLMFSNTNNTFKGGVSIAGKEADSLFKGGVSLLGNGSLPKDGGPLTLKNASLILNTQGLQWYGDTETFCHYQDFDLPAIKVEGGAAVCNSNYLKRVSAKSLAKNGDGTVLLSPAMTFEDLVEINGGTLKLSETATASSGLYWWWKKLSDDQNFPNTATEENCLGVDSKLTYAYTGWPYSGTSQGASHNQLFLYRGYIRIPGEEGTDVTFNFLTSIARTCIIKIDDTMVSHFQDNWSNLAGTVLVANWSRFAVAPAFTMKAGWHEIEIFMANTWDDKRGPQSQNHKINGNNVTWPENFGIGVDWEGRCTTNSANYVKLQDPGDGSLFRRIMPGEAQSATFKRGIAFAAGTVFDIDKASEGDFELPSLVGSPTIVGGSVHVAEPVWRLRKGDIALAKPLMVSSGSKLAFGDNNADVAINIAADAIAALKESKINSIKILAWADESGKPANRFITGDETRASHWIVKNFNDGVYIVDRNYLQVMIR